MTDFLVVLVLVAAGGTSKPATSSMTAAAQQALGAGTVLLFEERAALPSEEQAIALAERVRAGAVVEVDWVGPAHTHAILRVHTAQATGWAEREIDFAQSDPPTEYGRTIGFAVASMITRLSAPPAAPAVAVSPTPPVSPEGAPAVAPSSPSPSAPPPAPAPLPTTPDAGVPASTREAPRGVASHAFELAAVASPSPAGIGAAASALAYVFPSLAGQISAAARFGTVPAAATTASLTSWSVQLGGGATWRAARSSGRRPLDLELRADLFATDLVVYRGSASQSRWVPEARLEVEGVWFFVTPNVGMVLGAGAEATLGTTTVAVGNDIVTTILPFRAIGTVGIRARF